MAKVSKKMLHWWRRQKRGAVMKSETFSAIESKAAASGARSPSDVAGAAYWRTARKKFRQRRGK